MRASEGRGWRGAQAFEDGMSQEQLHEYTNIDPWFLAQLGELHQTVAWLTGQQLGGLSADDLVQVKRRGFSDPQIAKAVGARAPCARGRRLPAARRPEVLCGAEPLCGRAAKVGEREGTASGHVSLLWSCGPSGRHRGRLAETEGV